MESALEYGQNLKIGLALKGDIFVHIQGLTPF